MAKLLDVYRQQQNELLSQISERKTNADTMLVFQELSYRICVLETFQAFVKTAPITTEGSALSFHYQMLDAYIRFIESERKFGTAADKNGKMKRETAHHTLCNVTQDNRKRFSSFHASSPEQYKKEISNLANTVLPVWIEYRNTYVNI